MANHDAQQEHTEVDVLRSDDVQGGRVIAVITARERNGRRIFSFSIMKEYDRDGEVKRSKWLDQRHVGDVRKLVDAAEVQLEVLEDQERDRLRREREGGRRR